MIRNPYGQLKPCVPIFVLDYQYVTNLIVWNNQFITF